MLPRTRREKVSTSITRRPHHRLKLNEAMVITNDRLAICNAKGNSTKATRESTDLKVGQSIHHQNTMRKATAHVICIINYPMVCGASTKPLSLSLFLSSSSSSSLTLHFTLPNYLVACAISNYFSFQHFFPFDALSILLCNSSLSLSLSPSLSSSPLPRQVRAGRKILL